MENRKEPEADRKQWAFGPLLSWHMHYGTRPKGSPAKPGKRWSQIGLAKECDVSDRAVRAWLKAEYPPEFIERVEWALFGDSKGYDDWRAELRDAWSRAQSRTGEMPHPTAQPEPPLRPTPIDPPDLCLGRDADIELLLAALRGTKDTIGIVLGQAGIGKTTLTRQVAASPALADRFGGRRWFVALETALDRAGLREKIVVALGGSPGEPAAFDQACRVLADAAGLLVLDNLETPWEADMVGVQDDLLRLAAIPGLSLLGSLRGSVPPDRPSFTHRVRLDPLAEDAARALFLTHAPNIAPDDQCLADFLRALGGIPLAIELVARRAARHPEGLGELWDEYQARGPALAHHPHLPEGRLTSVIRSIDLSWQSSRLHAPGRRLFRLLGASPAGLARADREVLLGEAALEAAEQVLEVGLAVARDGRLDLLPPVRGYALAMTPAEPAELDRWCRHYLGLLAELGARIGRAGGAAVLARLAPEAANLDAAVAASHADRRQEAIAAAGALRDLLRYTGLGRPDVLHDLAAACQAADDPAGEAHCRFAAGAVAADRSQHAAARAAFEQALPLYRQVGDVQGEANCIRSLGAIALARSQHDAARAAYEQALPLYRQVGDVQGEANCIQSLGAIALERSQHDAARAAYEQALPLYRQVGDVQGEANCIRSLGDIALARSQHDAARAAYEQALPLYRQVGAVQGEGNCIQRLGDIARAEGNVESAGERYAAALRLYERIPEPYSMGATHFRLAELSAGAARAAHVAAARQAWSSIDRPDLVARLDALG